MYAHGDHFTQIPQYVSCLLNLRQRELPPLPAPVQDGLPMSRQFLTTQASRPISMTMSSTKSYQSPHHPGGTLGFRAWMSDLSKSVVGGGSSNSASMSRRRAVSISGPMSPSPDQPPLSSDTTASFGSVSILIHHVIGHDYCECRPDPLSIVLV